MRVIHCLLFLTLVLSASLGLSAPQTTTQVESTPLTAESDPMLLGIKPQEHRDYLLNISAGFLGGHILEGDEYLQGPFIALRYLPLIDGFPVWDYQAEVNKENLVGLSVGRRWYCCPEDAYMPYLRLSANLYLSGSDELAGLAAIRRWRLRASAGVGERFISEFGVGVAVTGADLYAQFGYSF